MPYTSSGFWYPGIGDTINSVSGLFSQAASASEDALQNGLKNDGVAKFADAAARTAAFTGVIIKRGTLTYLESSGAYESWNGTQWVQLGSATNESFFSLVQSYTLAPSATGTKTPTIGSFTLMPGSSVKVEIFSQVRSAGGAVIGVGLMSVESRANSGAWGTISDFNGANSSTSSAAGAQVQSIGYIPAASGSRAIDIRASLNNVSGINQVVFVNFYCYVSSVNRTNTI